MLKGNNTAVREPHYELYEMVRETHMTCIKWWKKKKKKKKQTNKKHMRYEMVRETHYELY